MNRLRLLDTFCGAGGASMGYHRAGFDVTGVDIDPQKNYPFEFVQADALEYIATHGREYDVIHASPPCQAYSVCAPLTSREYPRLIEATREALVAAARPYVIENVVGAPLVNPLLLCGTMFGLRVIRHRLFEMSHPIYFVSPCACKSGRATGNRNARIGITVTPSVVRDGFYYVTVAGNNFLAQEGRDAMGIQWMSKAQLAQAIPPAYTEFIGRQLIGYVR